MSTVEVRLSNHRHTFQDVWTCETCTRSFADRPSFNGHQSKNAKRCRTDKLLEALGYRQVSGVWELKRGRLRDYMSSGGGEDSASLVSSSSENPPSLSSRIA